MNPNLMAAGDMLLRLLDFHHTYAVPAEIILSLTGITYFLGFKVSFDQNIALMGKKGLIPAAPWIKEMKRKNDSNVDLFMQIPTLFWFIEPSDRNIWLLSLFGMIVSGAMVLFRKYNSFLFGFLWLGYHSIANLTGDYSNSFYSYGWESQLLETGFLCCFLTSPFGFAPRASVPVIWLFRWLIFRITIGAGLIKMRGDSCWRDGTALHYHFETQPIPSPISAIFHHLPKDLLSFGVNLDFLVQFYSGPMILIPGFIELTRVCRILAGVLQSGFMLNIALSGNYSFLNLLTIIPGIACFDDRLFGYQQPASTINWLSVMGVTHFGMDLLICYLIASRSWPVIKNLMSKSQSMNRSYDPFRLVNTYGAFGSVGKTRNEVIISASHDGEEWIEFEFPAKPGKLDRRPCFCAPYHYRLDWNIWFIGFPDHYGSHKHWLERREKWMWHFVYKLLKKDEEVLKLLDRESVERIYTNGIPKYIKCDMYHYKIRPFWSEGADWWTREFKEELIPKVSLESSFLGKKLAQYNNAFHIDQAELQRFPGNDSVADRARKIWKPLGKVFKPRSS